MSFIVGVPRETFVGERRVALVPSLVADVAKIEGEVRVESGAGAAAGFPDDAYREAGATVTDREGVFAEADVLLQVRAAGGDPEAVERDVPRLRDGQAVIGFAEPLTSKNEVEAVAARGANLFAIELMPRITRAQSMDALSSMATVAGYKIVLMAAERLPRMFPLMMTAAGTVQPAKVLILGAGVAGLQAIATARRLGAVVSGYDVRPVVREQVESLGATFVDLGLDTADSEDSGGYAKAQSEDFLKRQQEALGRVVAEQNVVITTALIPGRPAPTLLTEKMTRGMAPGSVVADLAAERGGNCALTRPGETVDVDGITIMGPVNIPSSVPFHASQMYARNLVTFLKHLVVDGAVKVDAEDEITAGTLVTRGGAVVNERVKLAWQS